MQPRRRRRCCVPADPAEQGGTTWTELILHNFGAGNDGCGPYSGVIRANATGELYGTTIEGGTTDNGTVYEITP